MAYCPNKGLVYLDNLAGFPATDVETVTAGNALHAWWATEVSNNVRHLIDAAGQHRVNSVAIGTTPVGRQHSFTANNTWEHLTSFGPFPWFVRPDEQLYRPVVRLGASVSNAAYTLDLRAALTGSDSPLSADLYLDKVEFTTSSTADAWLTPTGGDPNYLSPTPGTGIPGPDTAAANQEYVTGQQPTGKASTAQTGRVGKNRQRAWDS